MYLKYVNVKMGTDSVPRFSRGNTLPLAQLPFGMASFCPQTERISGQEEWFFSPTKPYLEGIRLTHQPSPWIGDYGTMLFTPQRGVIADTPSLAWSGYRINDSELSPDYIKVGFLRSQCKLELTPSERGAAISLNYENSGGNVFSILNLGGSLTFDYDEASSTLFGTSSYYSKGDAKDFKMYFVVKFADDVVDFCKINEEKCACHIGIRGKTADIRVSTSYISREMAISNLEGELLGTFDEIRANARKEWEARLGLIKIEADERKKRIFYSCMYRAFLFPRKMHEIENGKPVHYSPTLNKKCDGVMYTDTGFWDTSRTQFPLFSLIAREDYEEMLKGFLNVYYESGYLPRWHSLGEVGCMPSTLIDSVIADAVVNGIGDKALHRELLFAMIKHATVPSSEKRYGREGIAEYLKYGYVPCDMYRESVNLTLDFSYGDYCIATVAKALGENEIYSEYIKRSQNYKKIFDRETGFMRPKRSDGGFKDAFDPLKWGEDYTESSAYQATLFVPHDVEGLASLMGGRERFLSFLEDMIKMKPLYRVDGYGCEIHEMTEMAQMDMGQCAISNQPSFSIPYLFSALGEHEKARALVDYILENAFTEDSYPGDEDNGSMSAWYILSVIGKYKICPGKAN